MANSTIGLQIHEVMQLRLIFRLLRSALSFLWLLSLVTIHSVESSVAEAHQAGLPLNDGQSAQLIAHAESSPYYIAIDQNQQIDASSSYANADPAGVPLSVAQQVKSAGADQKHESTITGNCRIVTPVVFLSLIVGPKESSSPRYGNSNIEIAKATIEDINGNIIENLRVQKIKNGFALVAPSGSFKSELFPSADPKNGTINISGSEHKYTMYLTPPLGLLMLSNPGVEKDLSGK